jgi:hypothetical protein
MVVAIAVLDLLKRLPATPEYLAEPALDRKMRAQPHVVHFMT